jgi:hypothetical protein
MKIWKGEEFLSVLIDVLDSAYFPNYLGHTVTEADSVFFIN